MRRSLFRRMLEGWTVGMIVLSNIPTVQLSAQEPPLNAGALFLAFPVGAQAVGMGQTATASAGRGEAEFWTPAGPATLAADEFALHSASLVAGKSNALPPYRRQGALRLPNAAPQFHHGSRVRSGLGRDARRRGRESLGEGGAVGDETRRRHRLPGARAPARGVCVRPGRIERAQRGAWCG